MKRHAHFRVFASCAALALVLFGCAGLSRNITYYDPTTYKSLTDLKAEVIMVYESFAGESVDTLWMRSVRLKLAQMYEYEKGKGPGNAETTGQINIIRQMFDRHVDERKRYGMWEGVHLKNQIENISEAFDMAIETERFKNKSE
jgi:hypothetical protein